jgi:hypothetical protein
MTRIFLSNLFLFPLRLFVLFLLFSKNLKKEQSQPVLPMPSSLKFMIQYKKKKSGSTTNIRLTSGKTSLPLPDKF